MTTPTREEGRESSVSPPYLSFRTFWNFLQWLGEVGVPGRIDRTFWGSKLSGTAGVQTTSALRFFGLIDGDSHPTSALESLVVDEAGRQKALRVLIEKAYAQAIDGLALDRATKGQLVDRFKVYGLNGSILRKAITFFAHAARYAEMPMSPHIQIREAGEARPPSVRKRKPSGAEDEGKGKSQKTKTVPFVDPANATELPKLPAAKSLLLWGLLQNMPEPGRPWDKTSRAQWVSTLEGVLNIVYTEH